MVKVISKCLPVREGFRASFVVTLMALGLTACGLTSAQKDAIGQFGGASAALGDVMIDQLGTARSDIIEMRTGILATNPALLKGKKRDEIDGALSPKVVAVRIQAAKALKDYGVLLTALVQESRQKEIEAASAKFTQSIRGFDPNSKMLSDEQLGAIGEVVASIGGLWVEHKKAKALKTIVPTAHPQVEKLGELIASEFGINGAISKYIDAQAQQGLSASERILDSGTASVSDRAIAAAAFRKSIEVSRKANEVLPSIEGAARKMSLAHLDVVEALRDDKLNAEEIKAYVKTVEDLISAAKILL